MLIDLHLVLIPILLFLAAISAAAEASLFSLSRSQLEALRETRPQVYKRIRALIFRPESLLSTLIIGNECFSILVATLIVALLERHLQMSEQWIAVISMLVSSVLLLMVSEILPKVLAFRVPVITASVLVFPISWAHFVLTPVRRVFLSVSRQVIRLFGVQPAPPTIVSEKDFLTLVEVGAESGSLEREEKERIINVFNFSDRTVSSIMTPWKSVSSLREDMSYSDSIQKVRKSTFSRLPVLSADETRVVGMVHVKELLRKMVAPVPDVGVLKEILTATYIVSSHKKISKLFRELKQKKMHVALVVDEYGKHVGLITLEDILNTLFQTTRKPEEKLA